ncbi:DUF6454 family protein [Citricoccus sp. GCM10030269]|uniref:DUF6454 family protein n=1 Tax=Citricoccus sp. GCM10030269 TaxID=3273388 RepID=UPI0036230B93
MLRFSPSVTGVLAAGVIALTGSIGGVAATAAPSTQVSVATQVPAGVEGQQRSDVVHQLSPEAELFQSTTRSTEWDLVEKVSLDFETFHPQGMALVGDRIYPSSVEIIEPTVPYDEPVDGMDRSAGVGQGHVFVLTRDGELIKDIEVGEGDVYHPGGIDFDGEQVWVPVAEYRPNSASIAYTIDPETLQITEQFRHDDHVGGVVRDQQTGKINGVSWGSRDFFTWNHHGKLKDQSLNPSHFIDYQDCDYSGHRTQLCYGVTNVNNDAGQSFELGGIALTDLRTDEILHEVPVPMVSTAGHTITRNPATLEADGEVLRLFAAPDDGEETAGTELFVYEARP